MTHSPSSPPAPTDHTPEDETQRDTALRVCEEHLAGLDRQFTTNGVLPHRDIRLLLDVARILSERPAPTSPGAPESEATPMERAARETADVWDSPGSLRNAELATFLREVADELSRLRSELAAEIEVSRARKQVCDNLTAMLEEARDDARGDFFGAISAVADAMDLAANGPNLPLQRRSLHAVAVPMSEILKAMALCDANDAARPASPSSRPSEP